MEEEVNLEEVRVLHNEWKSLVNSPGWKRLVNLGEAQRNLRVGSIIRGETKELVNLVQREYERGECAGIDLFLTIPLVELERLSKLVETLAQSKENGDDHSTETLESDDAAP